MSIDVQNHPPFPLALPLPRVAPPDDDPEVEYLFTHPAPPLTSTNNNNNAHNHRQRRRGPQADDHVIIISSDEEGDDGPEPQMPGALRVFSPLPAPHPRTRPPHRHASTTALAGPSASDAPGPSRPRARLGGGLLSLRSRAPQPTNLHSQDNEEARARREITRHQRQLAIDRRNFLTRAIDHVFGGGPRANPGNEERFFFGRHPGLEDLLGPFGYYHGHWDDADENHGDPAIDQIISRQTPPKPTFLPSWTHGSAVPPPGFTFDFDVEGGSGGAPIIVDDEDSQQGLSASSSSGKTSSPGNQHILICARCNEPLLLGPQKMWALRCGHMICGGCVEKLSLPVEGKGKAKDMGDKMDDTKWIPIGNLEAPSSTDKGKGKAVPIKSEPNAPDAPVVPSPSRSRRSNKAIRPSDRTLRPRAARNPPSAISSAQPNPSKRPARSLLTEPGTIAEEHEYHCPVGTCLRSHWSAKVWVPPASGSQFDEDGQERGEWVWKQKDRVGAIAVFA